VEQEIRGNSIVMRYASNDENVQVNGYVFVMDMSGLSAKHMTHWSMDELRNWVNSFQVYTVVNHQS